MKYALIITLLISLPIAGCVSADSSVSNAGSNITTGPAYVGPPKDKEDDDPSFTTIIVTGIVEGIGAVIKGALGIDDECNHNHPCHCE